MLGVSRQHVVDMCDRGELPCVKVGKHRRIPRREVELFTSHRLTREQEKSLWLHRALLLPLLTEPDAILAKARENLRRWSSMHRHDGMTLDYFKEWERVLDDGLDAVVEVVTSTSEGACEMRQNSPFAGVLPDETRVKVLRSFREHWNREHDQVLVG
jgi:excisionase family DNA binding protein